MYSSLNSTYATVLGNLAWDLTCGLSIKLGQQVFLKSQKVQYLFRILLPVSTFLKVSASASKHLSNLFSSTVFIVSFILSTSFSTSMPVAGTYLNLPLLLFTTHHPPAALSDALE